jgi:flagellin FlaB
VHHDARGMTGLETAIILITFVTVAAVFGYAVLSAGLFSAERGKETVYAGLEEAKSNLELTGSVIAEADAVYIDQIAAIRMTVRNTIAGHPIDMTPCDGTASAANKCVISLRTPTDYFSNVKWAKTAFGAADDDNLLEQGEQFEIAINLADLGGTYVLTNPLKANMTFGIQLKPSLGSSTTIQRTLPAQIDPVVDLQ